MSASFRNLVDINPVDVTPYMTPAERLAELPRCDGFDRVLEYFSDYPARSLATPGCRAFMYHLVKALKPRLMAEIGTYYAGTTEIIARALLANGNDGRIVTIDPYGAERVPGILQEWPEQLRQRVIFSPANSMQFFIELDQVKPQLDMAFIDGNHSYGFAFYDLNMASKWIKPGGIIVMDDFDQPGVYWATKQFLELNPDWREIGGAFDAFDPASPFTSMRPSIENTEYLVLAAPAHIEVGSKPLVLEYPNFEQPGITGFTLHVSPDSGNGRLHAKIFLRSFYHDGADGDAEQLDMTFNTAVNATAGNTAVTFAAPFVSTRDRSRSYRQVEITLIWEPDDSGKPLRLIRCPDPIHAA